MIAKGEREILDVNFRGQLLDSVWVGKKMVWPDVRTTDFFTWANYWDPNGGWPKSLQEWRALTYREFDPALVTPFSGWHIVRSDGDVSGASVSSGEGGFSFSAATESRELDHWYDTITLMVVESDTVTVPYGQPYWSVSRFGVSDLSARESLTWAFNGFRISAEIRNALDDSMAATTDWLYSGRWNYKSRDPAGRAGFEVYMRVYIRWNLTTGWIPERTYSGSVTGSMVTSKGYFPGPLRPDRVAGALALDLRKWPVNSLKPMKLLETGQSLYVLNTREQDGKIRVQRTGRREPVTAERIGYQNGSWELGRYLVTAGGRRYYLAFEYNRIGVRALGDGYDEEKFPYSYQPSDYSWGFSYVIPRGAMTGNGND